MSRSQSPYASLHSSPRRRENLKTCLVQPRMVCAVIRKSSQNTTPSADNARTPKAENTHKIALRSSLSLDKRGPHTGWASLFTLEYLMPLMKSGRSDHLPG